MKFGCICRYCSAAVSPVLSLSLSRSLQINICKATIYNNNSRINNFRLYAYFLFATLAVTTVAFVLHIKTSQISWQLLKTNEDQTLHYIIIIIIISVKVRVRAIHFIVKWFQCDESICMPSARLHW